MLGSEGIARGLLVRETERFQIPIAIVIGAKANAHEERETREQRAEWFTEHDALSSPAP